MHNFLEHHSHPLPEPIAHRGYSARFPENTMAAFSAAVDLGYRCLETDVHVTADGTLVAFHDSELDRVADSQGRIEDMSWSDLRRVKVGGSEPIPRFAELLATWPDMRFIIDPKEDSSVEPLHRALTQADCWDRVCVGSFSDRRLHWLREQAGPKLCTSAGPKEITFLRFASYGLPIPSVAANCVQAPLRRHGLSVLDKSFVSAAHSRGLPVQAWTINSRKTMEHLLDIGVDGIMTDEAELLKKVFMRRSLWRD
ncbi:MAG: glycerophosphodiester phosphodiesterase [Rhodobacteraceae bacterium]|nr:glycerophosphodiester phosphodiesterase [Paracoccaceae bacterium]